MSWSYSSGLGKVAAAGAELTVDPQGAQYRFAGVAVASDLPLDLPVLAEPAGELAFSVHQCSDAENIAGWNDALEVLPHEPQAGPGSIEVRLSGKEYLLRVDKVVDLRFHPEQRVLRYSAAPGQGRHTVEHVLLDQALPRVLAYQGHLMLHASAIDLGGTALCLVGASGAGKSTLAASMMTRGYPLLADDVVRIELRGGLPWAFPAYPSLRLWGDTSDSLPAAQIGSSRPMADYSPKQVYRPAQAQDRPDGLPLTAIVLLEPGAADFPILRPAGSVSALMRIMGQTFALHPGVGSIEVDRLARMSALCSRVKPRELLFAHDFSQRETLLDTVLQALV